jgi:hypothetical protein
MLQNEVVEFTLIPSTPRDDQEVLEFKQKTIG